MTFGDVQIIFEQWQTKVLLTLQTICLKSLFHYLFRKKYISVELILVIFCHWRGENMFSKSLILVSLHNNIRKRYPEKYGWGLPQLSPNSHGVHNSHLTLYSVYCKNCEHKFEIPYFYLMIHFFLEFWIAAGGKRSVYFEAVYNTGMLKLGFWPQIGFYGWGGGVHGIMRLRGVEFF